MTLLARVKEFFGQAAAEVGVAEPSGTAQREADMGVTGIPVEDQRPAVADIPDVEATRTPPHQH